MTKPDETSKGTSTSNKANSDRATGDGLLDHDNARAGALKALLLTTVAGAIVAVALWHLTETSDQGTERSGSPSTVHEADLETDGRDGAVKDGEITDLATEMERGLASESAAKEQTFQNPKVKVLAEILESGNDNDQRLDTDFRNLSVEDRRALRSYYGQMEAEDRNGRGTVVFLLGRNIKDAEDVEFFRSVLAEEPCLSLFDCTQVEVTDRATTVDEHDQSQEITLAYPQIVALRSLESVYQQTSSAAASVGADIKNRLREVFELAQKNQNTRVRSMAQEALRRL
jgi:hypothetical protein